MSTTPENAYLRFARSGWDRGGFETDDILAAVLPLMRQVQAAHTEGRVAPLRGLQHLRIEEPSQLVLDPAEFKQPERNQARLDSLQPRISRTMEVVAESRRTSDSGAPVLEAAHPRAGQRPEDLQKPVYLPDYACWEHWIGHHDELTDIFSLGLILASLACGLDFTEFSAVEDFARHHRNLFALNPRLNPVLASVIEQMTELDRHKRAQDLGMLIRRLENYREPGDDFDFSRIPGFKESPLSGRRKLIQARLRDRLFEISRRNKLIYFQPTLRMLNLTVASVPLVLDYRHLRREQLFVWQPPLAALLADGTPLPLGKYLRFEDAPYLPGALDKIISEARRDRAEYGFAQLRLVLCFLRWHNLKEEPQERIHSPLLLLPVELRKKKGVRDNYVLEATTSEAEVNPALRHHLQSLYNLNLPETIDLRETALDQVYEAMKAQIQATEPGVTLHRVDRPQIELIHERARQRVNDYWRRQKCKAPQVRSHRSIDYCYERDNFRPLGLQLFLQKIRPSPAPRRDAAGDPPPPGVMPEPVAPPGASEILETERPTFTLRQGEGRHPYAWDFDLCSLTLGNFNYRKMTLVRDYTNLLETDLDSASFDLVFSLAPRMPEHALVPPLPLSEQHLIIPCDAAQASAIARARTGQSYIIQGPPGTGKSQTITNLIADYVARGQRVLFVCEKRAAIDIVFHRLRQQGLEELCCLIHDSQTDKKAFIQNLKQTYEAFLKETGEEDPETRRTEILRAMEQDLESLRRFSEAMLQAPEHTGLPLNALLRRLVAISHLSQSLSPELEEQLPDYHLWRTHQDLIRRLAATLRELGLGPCFAHHPLSQLGKAILQADRPLEMFQNHLQKAESLVGAVESALGRCGLAAELWDALGEIEAVLSFASRILPLARKDLLGLLDCKSPTSQRFDALARQWQDKEASYRRTQTATSAWKDRLSPGDTQNALALARDLEKSWVRFFSPAYWRLRRALRARYDFARHAVAPPWVKVLEELAAEHQTFSEWATVRETARQEWKSDDPDSFLHWVGELRTSPDLAHPSVRELIPRLVATPEGRELAVSLAALDGEFAQLNETLGALLAEHRQLDFPGLSQLLGSLQEQTGLLPELLPVLTELAELPEALGQALRRVPLPLEAFESAMAQKSLNRVYRQDRALNRFDGRALAQRMERLDTQYRHFLAQNAACLRWRIRQKFFERINLASLPASQLDAAQKQFKKSYTAGRRELEHEFGKTMRYKSIRDLAAGDTGQVIQDLKPIWLMSPLSVSDTLPLDPSLFDVVIFDEASQIPMEEAIPALYRAHQVIVVGDEMQLPPTSFFATQRSEADTLQIEQENEALEVDLEADSFLTQSSQNLPSTLLSWHYRSRFESLISFSNAAFYGGNLFTIPDRQPILSDRPELRIDSIEPGAAQIEALLERSISFHFMERGIYEQRRNPCEAAYIAGLVRGLLQRRTGLSIGIVAFSEAQQSEIEDALDSLAKNDAEFAHRLESEYTREENDQFCGLFVKNLENVQGDERDIIILSICYGYDAHRRMLMNFGPINQRGGEKRLNVIFSRSKHHMAVVSSIRHGDITNDYNDGANSLKNFLLYAEAVSRGDHRGVRRILENLNPLARLETPPELRPDAVVDTLADALRERGYVVDTHAGQSKFRFDLAVRKTAASFYQLGILVDTEGHYANPNLLERYLIQPAILRTFGWSVTLVLTKDWLQDRQAVINRLERLLKSSPVKEEKADRKEMTKANPPASSP